MRIFSRPICARCLGLYPSMFGGMVLLFWLDLYRAVNLEARPFEGPVLILAVTPALLDWARGRLRPLSGSNSIRLVTGALLGLALARTIFLHARDPFEPPSVEVLLFLIAGTVAGLVVSRAYRDPGE